MVTISAKHSIPEKAQAVANAAAQAYIDQDRLPRLQSGREAVGWLSNQLADLKTKLRNSEEAFQRFKEREEIITLDGKRSEELAEISKINTSYLTARASRIEIEAIVSEIENLNIPIALLSSPVLQKLGTELSQLQTELADNCITGKLSNLKGVFGTIEFIAGDIRDLSMVRQAVQDMDYVLRQAALPSVSRSVHRPVETNDTNVTGTLNVLVAARDANVKRVVYAGSSSAYGNSPSLPKREDMPANPISPYAISKYTGEQSVRCFMSFTAWKR